MPVVIPDDSRFQVELGNAGSKLVVVDFMASWCGPCHRIAPIFEELSRRYPKVVFLKVDVDECSETAQSQGVTAMPTFIFYRNKVKLGQVQGADAQAVENKIKELGGGVGEDASDCGVQGHVDLSSCINKSSCECLNDSDDHPFANSLTSGDSYLESDCDEQLILSYGFNQSVKLHSLKIEAPEDNGPKTLKLFINLPRTLDFDQADTMEPVQTLVLQPSDLNGGLVPLRYVKFQNVQNLQIFVKDNLSGAETTRINHIGIIGSPISVTNMGDFKRVAGKKGESHF